MMETSLESFNRWSGIFLVFAVTLFAGCGFSVPKAEVSGTVETTEGIPLESGMLMFTPVLDGKKNSKAKGAVGKVSKGTFTLSTDGKNDGAAIGRHRVRLTEANFADNPNGGVLAPESLEIEIKKGENKLKLIVVVNQKDSDSEDEYGDEVDDDDDDDDD